MKKLVYLLIALVLVFALAGCDFQLGRENDGLCQPMTTCFRSANVDVEVAVPEHAVQVPLLYPYPTLQLVALPVVEEQALTPVVKQFVHVFAPALE